MPSVEELETRVSDLRQEASAERIRSKELSQEAKELRRKNRILQQEISRLQTEAAKQRENDALQKSINQERVDLRNAVINLVLQRYGGQNPFGHVARDCTTTQWCVGCTTKVWKRAADLVGAKL